MSPETTVLVMIASLTGWGYPFALIARRRPDFQLTAYWLNLFALGLCGSSLFLRDVNLLWISILLWNLIFQNILVTRLPKKVEVTR
jgi:hypothetical protein